MKKSKFFKSNATVLSAILIFSMIIGIQAVPIFANLPAMDPRLQQMFNDPRASQAFGYDDLKSSPVADPYQYLDPLLKDYIKTGIAPEGVRQKDGKLCVLLATTLYADLYKIAEHMDLISVANLGVGNYIRGWVKGPEHLRDLYFYDDVGVIMADAYFEPDLQPQDDLVPEQYIIQDVIGASLVNNVTGKAAFDEAITGDGITIGIADTGVDFGITDLAHAYDYDTWTDAFGTYVDAPTSFDATGAGLAVTGWSGMRVATYLPTAGFDFLMYRGDSYRTLHLSVYGYTPDDIYLGPAATGIQSLSGVYQVGVTVQVAPMMPYGRAFFVWMLTDTTTPGVYDRLYVDWETSWALTADWAEIDAMGMTMEWDFYNNRDEWYEPNSTHAAISTDFDGDGVLDFSMGSFGNTLDIYGQITGDLLTGIDPYGGGFAIMSDTVSGQPPHGTWCAAIAAGRGIVEYDIWENGTLTKLPGIAPGARIMGLKKLAPGDQLETWLWGSGFHPNVGGTPSAFPYHLKYHNWTYTGDHQCEMISNSWGSLNLNPAGNAYGFIWGYYWYDWTIDYLTGWTGTLFIVSQGNNGPGYGSGTSPNSAASLMVGGVSMTHPWQPIYDNLANYTLGGMNQVTGYSSRGPHTMGLPKPNIVAPIRGISPSDSFTSAGFEGVADGTYAWMFWGGTSYSSPIAAGIAAMVYEVGADEGWLMGLGWAETMGMSSMDPGWVKSILESTATDLSFNPFAQGAGLVNAYRAVHAAFGNDTDGTDPIMVSMSESAWNYVAWGSRQDGWRGYYMGMRAGDAVYGNGWSHLWEGNTWLDDYFPYLRRNYHPSWEIFFTSDIYDNSLYGTQPGGLFPSNSTTEEILVFNEWGVGMGTVDSIGSYQYTLLNDSSATMTSTSVYTTFALEDNFDAIFMDQFNNSDYAEIILTYDYDTFQDLYDLVGYTNYVFLMDWNDSNNDNIINTHVGPADPPGEVRRINADYSYSNYLKLCVGNPEDTFYQGTNKGATLWFHDVGSEVFLYRTLDVTVHVRLYEKETWEGAGFPVNVTASNVMGPVWDVDISVDAAASPGFYEGYLEMVTGGNVAGLMPVVVRVDGVVPGGTGSLTWGGSDDHPYDNGAMGGSINMGDDWETVGDWRFYYVDISYQEYFFENDSTMWVMTNVTWTDPDTVIEVFLYMTGYGNNAYFQWPFSATSSETGYNSPVSSTWPGQNVLITDWTWDEYSYWDFNYTVPDDWFGPDNSTWSCSHRGFLMIALHMNHWGSSEALDDLTITVTPILNSTLNHGRAALLRTAEYTEYDTYWDEWAPNGTYLAGYPNISHNALDGIGGYAPTASLVTDSTAITDDMVINGPHAEITATFGPLSIPGMPTVGIRQTAIDMLSGVSAAEFGTVTAAEAIPGWFSDNPANIEAFMYIDDVLEGQECRFTVEFGTWVGDPGIGGTLAHQGDFDIFVWAPSDSSFSYDTSLTGGSTASGANPEVGFFIAPESGTYTIGIDYYSGTLPMGWICLFSAASVDTYIADGLTYTFDTHAIGTNAVFDIRARAITGTSLDLFADFSAISASNVTITNFFPPTVTLTYPVGGEDLPWNVPFNFTWTGSDPNEPEDLLQYTVEVSNDTGATWKVVVFGTILNQASWDPTSAFYGFPPGDQFLVRVNVTDGRWVDSDVSGATFTLTYVEPPPPPPWELITVAVVAIVVVVILLVTCLLKRKQTK